MDHRVIELGLVHAHSLPVRAPERHL